MKIGIDVSTYQGNIDWSKVKDNVGFAILRCGLGDDIRSQDDNCFERNYTECMRLGIPFAVYFFTYAQTKDKVDNEIAHIKRLLSGKTIKAPVYIDVENTRGLNWRYISNNDMTEVMKYFKSELEKLGYSMGIYSSRSAFWNEKMTDAFYESISKWVAEYSDKLHDFNRPYDIWQATSNGSIPGIGGRVDINYMTDESFNKIFGTTTIRKTNEEIAQEVIAGKWGNGAERKARLTAAGYDYSAVQSTVNELYSPKPKLKTNEEIAREVIRGQWGNGAERKARLTAAGYDYKAIQSIVNKLLRGG